jgi:Na+-transporting methylmalonyl-CoA/oxaloacetate decarboxylase gamma subunit
MSVCPFDFSNTIEQSIDTLAFNYSFDIIPSITTVNTSNSLNEGISIKQTPKIPSIILSLGGRTTRTVMSIGINGKITGFNLYNSYITKVFPKIKKGSSYSFVIEGLSLQNTNGEKILVYIPLNQGTGSKSNMFYPMEAALTSESKTLRDNSTDLSIDFNKFIPENKYYYHTYTDSASTLYHIITFDTSLLSYDPNFGNILSTSLDKKTTDYLSEIKEKNNATISYPLFVSTSNPINQDVIPNTFEDNIYIDCQPVDLLNNEGKNYLQTTVKEAVGLVSYIEKSFPYLIFIVFLSLLIYFIYSLSSFIKSQFQTGDQPTTNVLSSGASVLTYLGRGVGRVGARLITRKSTSTPLAKL